MLSFASLLVLLQLGGSVPAPATVPAAAVPDSVAARVSTWLAREWSVPERAVRLEWGRLSLALPGRPLPFRVTGRGVAGWYVVVFDPSSPGAVAVRLRAGVEDSVLVAARPLATGALLSAADLKSEPRVCWGPPAPPSESRPGPGWEVRRALATGEVLARPAVTPPMLVVAGEPVRLVWTEGAVQVSVVGIALNRARQGELVRARVEGRSDRLVGTATATGTVVISSGGDR
jgi:flagella basal body P-ring formation protein FlgA